MKKLETKWFLYNKKMVMFKELDDPFNVDDKVIKFLENNKPNENGGEQFEVEFEEQDDEQVVVKMKPVKTSDEKEKPSESDDLPTSSREKPDHIVLGGSNGNDETKTKERTIRGISKKDPAGIIFEEEENVWYDIDLKEVEERQLSKGDVIKITVEKQEGKKNQKITLVEKVKPKVKKEHKRNTYSETNLSTQVSIETQTCVDHASSLVSALVNSGVLADINDVKKFRLELMEQGFEFIQSKK